MVLPEAKKMKTGQVLEEGVKPAGNTPNSFTLSLDSLKTNGKAALKSLLEQLVEKKSKSLFPDLPTRILLNIVSFRVPNTPSEFFNIHLSHSPYPEGADIIFIIKHDKNKDDEDYQEDELKASLFKQKLLMDHGIKIREVFTLKQFRKDFHAMEAKRALIKRIDGILVDKSIIKHVPDIVGRESYKKRKYCVGVNFAKDDLAVEIQKALKTTVLHVSNKGCSSTVTLGTDELSVDQLLDNVMKACENLNGSYPGGWPNINKLNLTCSEAQHPPLPIYIGEGVDDIKKSVSKKRKLRPTEVDEISTQPDKKVTIRPDGIITIQGGITEDMVQ